MFVVFCLCLKIKLIIKLNWTEWIMQTDFDVNHSFTHHVPSFFSLLRAELLSISFDVSFEMRQNRALWRKRFHFATWGGCDFLVVRHDLTLNARQRAPLHSELPAASFPFFGVARNSNKQSQHASKRLSIDFTLIFNSQCLSNMKEKISLFSLAAAPSNNIN